LNGYEVAPFDGDGVPVAGSLLPRASHGLCGIENGLERRVHGLVVGEGARDLWLKRALVAFS
jgi:hypothetical protein